MHTALATTIVAIATPFGESAIGIIRISGPNTYQLVNKLCQQTISREGYKFQKAYVYDQAHQIVDEVIVLKYVAPKSYTGEDMVELNCHGNMGLLQKILGLLITYGAKQASAGEFTKRAFLNQKLNIHQAFAINNLIHAKTPAGMQTAISTVVQKANHWLQTLQKELFEWIAKIEINIDYPEYEQEIVYNQTALQSWLLTKIAFLKTIITNFEQIKHLYEGYQVVLIGKPNVGKSSLLNALCQSEQAIVTPIAGTTRDLVQKSVVLDGILYHFIDTAGLNSDTTDLVETLGIAKTKQVMKTAHLLLVVLDQSAPLSASEQMLIAQLTDQKQNFLLVKNKTDLGIDQMPHIDNAIAISAKHNEIGSLIKAMQSYLMKNPVALHQTAAISSEQEKTALLEIIVSFQQALAGCERQAPADLLAIDLQSAYAKLNVLLGTSSDLSLIDQLFQNFCLGK